MSSDSRKLSGLRIIRILVKICSLLSGLVLAGVAIWAYQLGIDNNPTIGPKRFGMFLVGLGFILWAAWDWIKPGLKSALVSVCYSFNRISLVRKLKLWFPTFLEKIQVSSWFAKIDRLSVRYHQAPFVIWTSRHWLKLSFGVVTIFTIGLYLWVFSAGKMMVPPGGTKYFSWLADAFREGQFHLLIKPSPGLMSLSNPFDYRLRSEVNYIWDASLYDGKYYLYWGPVPGAVVLFLQWFSSDLIRDSLLTFIFVCGAFVFAGLLLLAIWHRFEKKFPGWGYFGGLLAVALNVPMVWLLTRPAVYEASIAGGQFFLLMGLYWSFLAVSRPKINKVFLLLAGLAWSLTAGTRINLIPAIILLSFMVLWRVYQMERRKLRTAFVSGLAFLLPLILMAIFLASYNYTRFDSIFEFGHRYQLSIPTMPTNYNRVTDIDYSFPNLFSYLIRLPEFKNEFPFIMISWEKSWPFFIRLPKDYYSAEPVAGLLWLVPITGLALFVFIRYLWLKIDQSNPKRSPLLNDEDRSLLRWLNTSLISSGGLQLVLLLFFFSSSLRYQADFALIAMLLATVFIAQISASFQLNKFRRRLLAILWLTSSGLTAIFAIIVNISGYAHGFERNNPDLYHFLFELFS